MQSHHKLDEMFTLLYTLITKGSFVDLVFRLVLFHQSFAGCEDFPNMVNLTKEERLRHCGDPLFYKLLRFVMTADSCSYIFVMDERGNLPVFKRQIKTLCCEYSKE